MSPPNAIHPYPVCDQVHPTDPQYRDYKRSGDSFWSKLDAVKLDTAKLEHLFETKSKEIPVTKVNKQWCLNSIQEMVRFSELTEKKVNSAV